MAPGGPDARKNEEAEEVEIELSGPGHCGNVAEENGKQVDAMVCDDDCRVCRQHDQNQDEQGAEQVHLGFSRFLVNLLVAVEN